MEERPLFQVQPCLLCKGVTTQGYTELVYEFPRFRITVRDVPAALCNGCGERFVPGDFGVWLGDEIARLAAQVEAFLADEDALRGMEITMRLDGERLVNSGRVRKLSIV